MSDTPPVLPEEEKKRIAAKIDEKVRLPCPRCGNRQFGLIDGYITLNIASNPLRLQLGGQVVPCAAVVCGNCGYVFLHAAGVLGIMPDEEGK